MAIERNMNIPTGPPADVMDFDVLLETASPLTLEGEAELVEFDDGSLEIAWGGQGEQEGMPFDANLVDYIDDSILRILSNELMAEVEEDLSGREDWVNTYTKGLEVLGFDYEERNEPWPNACGTYSTVLTEPVIQFQAETMVETFPAGGPVRTKIVGEETPEKREAAKRVQEDMNYQLLERIREYRPEHEKMLFNLALAGSSFKKIYQDPQSGYPVAVFVPAEDVIVPYGASDLDSCDRLTHVMRKNKTELDRMMAAGFYAEIELDEPMIARDDLEEAKASLLGFEQQQDKRYVLYEIHATTMIEGLDDEDDETAKPYVFTIEKNSGEVLSVYRNWKEGDSGYGKQQHFVHYMYVPGFGFYGLGLVHIVGGYARTGTSLIRQLVDAGTLSNLPGGLKTRGLRIKDDDEPIAPGEFKEVDVVTATSIKDNIMTLPYGEPSATLFQLLEKITQDGRRLAATGDLSVSDMSAQAPVGTTLAILERTLKPLTAIHARVHYTMKREFQILKPLIVAHTPLSYDYPDAKAPLQDERQREADYRMTEVIPVSDPNSSTLAQRVVQLQTAMEMAAKAPHIYDEKVLHRQMLETIGINNAEKIVPLPEDMTPVDPVSENMNVMVGKPIKAFLLQDHDAHIATHMAFIQDPSIAQLIGQNPMAQQIGAALHAHVAEHAAFAYRKQVEQKLGVPLTGPNAPLPVEVEVSLSQLMAQAGQQVAAENAKRAAQQQAQQQAQDPIVQTKMMEAKTRQAEVQRKQQKDAADQQLKQREQERKERKDIADDVAREKDRLLEHEKAAVDAAKAGEEMQLKREQMAVDADDIRARQALDGRKQDDMTDLELLKEVDGQDAQAQQLAEQKREFDLSREDTKAAQVEQKREFDLGRADNKVSPKDDKS